MYKFWKMKGMSGWKIYAGYIQLDQTETITI